MLNTAATTEFSIFTVLVLAIHWLELSGELTKCTNDGQQGSESMPVLENVGIVLPRI
jgi:hypothetical protein